ncbi:MAG: PA2169 family four-helix-bundle protein [Ferruginibacter sp.]
MEINERTIEVVKDLIQINNDRVTGYERAGGKTKTLDIDLQAIFLSMANDSRKYTTDLTAELARCGWQNENGYTSKGKIYQVWMDVNATFSGFDRQSILESCEFGEDTIQKAYSAALAADVEMDIETRNLLEHQKDLLNTAYRLIKSYLDAAQLVHA